MRQLSRLRAPMGKFAVLGNHDYWCDGGEGGPTINDWLERTGIEVLTNRNVRMNNGVRLVGVDDLMAGEVNYTLGFEGARRGEPTIVMSHNPGTYLRLCFRECITLAGHTHGGQLYMPGISDLWLGRFNRDGTTRPDARVGCTSRAGWAQFMCRCVYAALPSSPRLTLYRRSPTVVSRAA